MVTKQIHHTDFFGWVNKQPDDRKIGRGNNPPDGELAPIEIEYCRYIGLESCKTGFGKVFSNATGRVIAKFDKESVELIRFCLFQYVTKFKQAKDKIK